MNDILNSFFKSNGAALMIAIVGVVSSYTLISYRVSTLEAQVNSNNAKIELIRSSNNSTAVDIAQIQKDIEFIRFQIDRSLKN